MKLLKDFRTFLLRGNVVDLAVAVVVGTAFTAVVQALVRDLLTPIIALIFGKRDFSALSFTINKSHFLYGDFVNFLITFVTVAAALFFFVVVPVNALMARRKTEPPLDERVRDCPECLSEIPVRAKRCAFCTAEVGAVLA
jgi:large conductance mechanosensitive channel